MRKVQCVDCGKSYDYDVDDFCPRCGSFNPPPNSGATKLEEELLSRFRIPNAAGGKKQTRPSRPVYGDGSASHPTYGSGPELKKGRSHAARIQDCGTCAPARTKKKGGGKLLLVLLIILLAVFVVMPLVGVLVETAGDMISSFQEIEFGIEREPAPEAPLPDGWYESYDSILLSNGQEVVVGDFWEPWLPEEYMEEHPGTRCGAVALWVFGEPGGSDIPVALAAEDGTLYLPEELPAWIEEESGVDSISLADGIADEEIFGYSVYFLPEDAAGQELKVMIMDEETISVSIGMEWE